MQLMHIIRVSSCTPVCSRAIICYAVLLSMYLLRLICAYMRTALYANVIRCICICYVSCRSTLPLECFPVFVRLSSVVQFFFIQDRLVPIVVNSRTLLIINNNLLPIEYFSNYFANQEIFGIRHVNIAITSDFRIVTN